MPPFASLPSVSPLEGFALGPEHSEALQSLEKIVFDTKRLLVVTGAGISTESGIPDYRSPGRPEYRPLQSHEFEQSEYTRTRYWARSCVGYRRMSRASPNLSHRLLAALERDGRIQGGIITQNVDRLHQRAGSHQVLELHGTIHEVECLDCDVHFPRDAFQRRLEDLNHSWLQDYHTLAETLVRPDGDVDLPSHVYGSFRLPHCGRAGCRGALRPSVVFHGGTVPAHVTRRANEMVDRSDGVLVLGSSLAVFSAYRLVQRAAKADKPVGIVTFGPTRGDGIAQAKLDGAITPVLAELVRRRGGEWSRGLLEAVQEVEHQEATRWTPPMPRSATLPVHRVPPAEGTLGPRDSDEAKEMEL